VRKAVQKAWWRGGERVAGGGRRGVFSWRKRSRWRKSIRWKKRIRKRRTD